MRTLAKVLWIAAGLAVLSAAPAAAQVYPPTGCSLALSSSSVAAGDDVGVSTTGCAQAYQSGATVQLTLTSDPVSLGTVTADGNGHFSTTVTIPSGTSGGSHTITATGPDSTGATLTLSAGLTVSAAGGGGGSEGALAFTGADSRPLAWIALAAVTVGAALVLASRRRAQVRAARS